MSTSSAFSWKSSRVLITDDEPDMREIFAAWFRTLGCTVQEAADGREALDILTREHFDVVVTDVRMPRLTGVELVRALHRLHQYTPVVIFVSGFMDFPIPDAFDLGVEAILSKPCEKNDLIGAVRRSLLRQELEFEPPQNVAPPSSDSYLQLQFALGPAASQVAIGRGGMSFDVPEPILRAAPLGFAFTFAQGPISRLEGWGALRWCENLEQGSRVGVEFLYLEEETRRQLRPWLRENSPVSFIPRNCQVHLVSSG